MATGLTGTNRALQECVHGYGATESHRNSPLDLSEPESLIDTIVDGRYRLTGLLGSGGMATVFRAEHVTIKRPVALKLLSPSMGKPRDFAARFEREAYALGQLDHPNCVEVIDFGQTSTVAYLVMDLVDGKSLAEILDDEERLDWRRALRLCRDVLEGLASAHAKGIVHRDIKPQNVMVSGDGDRESAKVLDFGIAKLLGDGDKNKITAIGTAVGTPTYISPEQAIGDPVDGTADLYSVSVMLYEMISGRPPYRSSEPMKVVFQHINAPIPSIAQLCPELPEALDRLLREGLAKRPTQRIASAREYLARIDALLAEPQNAPISVEPERSEPVLFQHKTGLRTVGLLVAVIATVALVGSFSSEPTHDAQPSAALPIVASAQSSLEEGAPEPSPAIDHEAQPELDRSSESELLSEQLLAARAHVRSGDKLIAKQWWSEAFKQYRVALELDPSLRRDPRLIRNALKSLQSRRHPSVGTRFIREHIGEPAIPFLREAAKNRRSRNFSRRAAKLLRQMEG